MIWMYAFIFFSKVIENALGTLRLIVIANGKKTLGAILNAFIALVWVLAAGAVIVDIKKDPLRIVFFILGSTVGSYIGGILEEKLALGSSLVTAIVSDDHEPQISAQLRQNGHAVTVTKGEGLSEKRAILFIMAARKQRHEMTQVIRHFDDHALVVCGNASTLYGGYQTGDMSKKNAPLGR